MDETNAIVKAQNIGIAFGDELTAGEKIRLVKEYVREELAPYHARIAELIEIAKTFVITNDDERKRAASIFLEVQREIDEAQALRKKLLANAKKEIRSIEIPFSELEKLQERAEDDFRGFLKKDWLDFEDARKIAQDLHNSNAEKERSDGDCFVPDIILAETERRIETDNGFTTIRKDIKVTVTDRPAVLAAVSGVHCDCPHCKKEIVIGPSLPNVIVVVDEQAAKRYFKAAGIRQAPGFKIDDDAIVAGYKNKKED